MGHEREHQHAAPLERREEGLPIALDPEQDEVGADAPWIEPVARRAARRRRGSGRPGCRRAPPRGTAHSRGRRPAGRSSLRRRRGARPGPRPRGFPTCRIPPPRSFRARRAFQMKSFEPTRTLPTGQARPFERQNVTESAGPASSRGSSSSATTAFQNRAPSMCSGTPPSWAISASSRTYAGADGLVVGVGAGVLEHHEAGDRVMDVGRVAERFAHLSEVEGPIRLLFDRPQRLPRRRRRSSPLRAASGGRGRRR